MPAVTVDAVIRRVRPEADDIGSYETQFLLIQRRDEPYKNCWALPGGFVNPYEEPVVACMRELKEETGIILEKEPRIFHAAGGKGRDPRGWVISIVFAAQVPWDTKVIPGDDAVHYEWFNWHELPEMAFDHREIIEEFWKSRVR
jgi:8-oxo-dGTP diphosphatase